MEEHNPNLTASEYHVWLITTLSQLPPGPYRTSLERAFDDFTTEIAYLERCYSLPNHDLSN